VLAKFLTGEVIVASVAAVAAIIAAVAAIIAAVAAIIALVYNSRSAGAAGRAATAAEDQTELQRQAAKTAEAQTELQRQAAKTAEEQTKLQRQVHIDSAQPQVWVDIRPDETVGTLLNLVVGNSGTTLAKNVRVTSDRKLPHISGMAARVTDAQRKLSAGLSSLPPGRTYMWPLGQGFNLIKRDVAEDCYALTVEAEGRFGPVPSETYVIDIAALSGILDRPVGSLHELTRAVRELKDG
jgi:hypothetical protein